LDTVTDLVALRAQAFRRLRKEGVVAIPTLELMYASYRISTSLAEEGFDDFDPSAWMEYEFEVLGMGKWDWLVCWLSPLHRATALCPDVMGEVANIWLGHRAMPAEVRQRLQQVASALGLK
jgi:hypothetical protein